MIATYRACRLVTALALLVAVGCGGDDREQANSRGPRARDTAAPATHDAGERDAGGADDRAEVSTPGSPRELDAGAAPDGEPSPDAPRPPTAEDALTVNPLALFGLDTDPPHPVFDQTAVHEYRLEVDPADWQHINDTAYLEEYVPARLTYEGKTYEQVAIRFKGFRGSLYNCFLFDQNGAAIARLCDKLSLKLSFDEYDENGRFFGLRKLNFHAMNNDPSRLRERLAYFLFRRFGVPAPRAVHATLTVNGQSLGLYALVEQPDGRFARDRFPDGGEGNVYKERWPTLSTDPGYFKSGLESNAHDPDVDVSGMVSFARDVQAASDDTIEQVLREHTDFPALMRYLAVDRALQLWDGITAFRCQPEENVPPLPPAVLAAQTPALGWETCQNKNYYFYEASTHDRIWLVAWDTDVSIASIPSPFPPWDQPPAACEIQQSGRPPMCDPLIAWFATTLRPQYVTAGRAFLASVFRAEVVERAVLEWSAQIQPYLGAGDLFALTPDALFQSVTQVHSDFEAELAR